MPEEPLDALLRRVTVAIERIDVSLAGINTTLARMTQQLDRTDATHAGISRTLAQQTTVLERLATTLDRWLGERTNGPAA